jgi:hypothetical protein
VVGVRRFGLAGKRSKGPEKLGENRYMGCAFLFGNFNLG